MYRMFDHIVNNTSPIFEFGRYNNLQSLADAGRLKEKDDYTASRLIDLNANTSMGTIGDWWSLASRKVAMVIDA